MVLTRSKSRDNNLQNVTLTQEDYDCAHTLMQLRSSDSKPSSPAVNVKLTTSQRSNVYNLRPVVNSATYNIHDDWDTLHDPTWVPWTERHSD